MKRILFFNYEYPPLGGGAGNATKFILDEYALRSDIHVDLVTSAIGKKYEKMTIGKNVIVHRIPIGKDPRELTYQTPWELISYTWRAYFFAKKLLEKNTYDLTHSFFGVPCGLISLLLKKKYNRPYIVSLRGADVPGYSERFVGLYFFLTPLIKKVWNEARFVVTNSAGLTLLAQASAPEQKIEKIFNGVDIFHFTPGQRTQMDREKRFRILCASRLSRRKGINDAVSAFAQIAPDYPKATLTIAGGEGNTQIELKKQVKDLALEDRVTFTGHYTRAQAPKMYQNADLFVMPSHNEGMSNNLLEALAVGLPVLMTPTGGAEELVRDGENGYIIKMRNADDIAQKMQKIITDPEAVDSMGVVSREIAEGMRWSNVADQYVELYNETATKIRKPRKSYSYQ